MEAKEKLLSCNRAMSVAITGTTFIAADSYTILSQSTKKTFPINRSAGRIAGGNSEPKSWSIVAIKNA